MDEALMRGNRKRFFAQAIQQIHEMRSRLEAMAASAVDIGLPDSSFDEWRAALDKQEKAFQAEADKNP